MMISPETYYDEYLKDKNEKQILSTIRGLKNDIGHLKNVMEHSYYLTTIKTYAGENVQIYCNRLYLARAIKALKDIGCTYKYSQSELKSIKLQKDLKYIAKIIFEIGVFFQDFTNYTVEIKENYALIKTSKRLSKELKETERRIDKDELLSMLSDLYIGEWRKYYSPKRFGYFVLDGTQWQLKIEFNNGRKSCEFSGSNSYPYNFNKLLKFFDIDGEAEI